MSFVVKIGSGQHIDVTCIGEYRPLKHYRKSNEVTAKILELKYKSPHAVAYFVQKMQELKSLFAAADAIATVPRHCADADQESGIALVARRLCRDWKRVDLTQSLRRTTTIGKQAWGGVRDASLHLQTIAVSNRDVVAGKNVLLMDDVLVTGNSLVACNSLLHCAGVLAVTNVSMGYVYRILGDTALSNVC